MNINKIKIYSAALAEPATIKVASSAVRSEKINSDNILNFVARIKDSAAAYINDTNVVGLDGDYFDIAYYKKDQQSDGKMLVSVECEHVSYRLNRAVYNITNFTQTGTPTAILTAILSGTGFTVGTVDFTTSMTFSLQQATSRRALLMQFVALLGGEVKFDGFSVSILTQRGSATPRALTVGHDITVISKAVDKRNLDSLGNPTISYACGLLKILDLELGDTVTLDYDPLDINVTLRIVSMSYDPYNPNRVTIEVGNYVNELEDDLYRIETAAVMKDATYNGCKIGPENGFEAIRNDLKARAYFKSDGMKFQSGDGTGNNWTDRLYYEYDSELGTTVLVFDGKLSAGMIEVLSALITPNLYAGKATIAELTVDQIDTSGKVQNYLNSDTSDVKYWKGYDQYIEFIIASTDGNDREQAVNRDNEPLYWTDNTHAAATTEETAYPVRIYVYTEVTKGKLYFDTINEVEVMVLELGAGNDAENPDWGKTKIYKDSDGLKIDYYVSTSGAVRQIKMTDLGIVATGSVGDNGLRNVYVGTTQPATPENNMLWIDTDA